ncbi:hypothetical protein GobsT_31790 [Gemmata obscuriglobus]|uniref:Uncharacterized protein n=1 Tax=Gemmata obscuriglobus TaxID=114 RepID=A0A2Z3HBQ0_9BACT|nr:hypothetical protein [Gemmata obscuriglobus]AWM38640.1 hypothetical protein C1280_17710 [Gemmata obscuriglobus]QEG28401.1 hypothetical protein GobsT_31790 [Gemmata obscuriglobus]VTS06339.1 Putative IS4 family transposase OS=Planctomyces maris DSM 8797 GN=PM8797T_13213 PE=4 SV=1 [Gemmata obscuriglobus UQM 2246]
MSSPEVRALLGHLLDTRRWDEDQILTWSRWRQERNRIAKRCHRKRHQAALSVADAERRSRGQPEAL